VREIRTLGSAWGDEFKKPCSLGEGTGMKMSDNSEAPQRANASRLVSTILFDLWAERWRRREATGDMIMVRYADDLVAGFQHESDARRFWEAMPTGCGSSRCRFIRIRPA
jgi:hypothetical protein